ncbi:MAG: flagellar biosynthesis protein FliQ [Bacillota bacterium]
MPQELIVSLARRSLVTVLMVAGPMLGIGLITGLAVSVLQATTQINEQTMSFVPKIVAIFVAAMLFGPWMINVMSGFASEMLGGLAGFIR